MKSFPDSWEIEAADQICSDIVDCINKTAPVVEEDTGFKMIRTTNVKAGRVDLADVKYVDEAVFRKWTRRILPKNGDIILTREAPLGEVGLLRSDDKVFLGQRTMIYRADEIKLNQNFLYYSLLGPTLQAQIRALGSGSTVEHVRVPEAEKLQIPFPPIATQKKIAAILSAYDDLIENNKRRIALLEKMAEEIYREWFVRFRFPGHDKVTLEKGVPEGWELEKLGSVLELCYGKALKEEERVPGEFYVYGSGGIVGTHNKALVKSSGLIVGRKGNVGSVYLSNRGFFPIDTVYFVKSEFPNSYLFFLLRSMNFINNDAAVPGLNRNQAYANQLYMPPAPLVSKFSELVDKQFEMKRILTQQNEKLIAARDRLLPRLISGKLSVETLDIRFPPGMEERQ
jgi:type I restriction enzyme S subunit